MALERLQKIIAAAGIASRRKAEELIQSGLVSVNGKIVTELGSKADPDADSIRVNNKPLKGRERHEYIALNKPRGYVTTVSDPEGRPTVMELVRSNARLYPVGRLDFNSEGLLLLTNDGDLAHKLMKAASHIPKTYLVKIGGQPAEAQLQQLRAGVSIAEERDPKRRVRTAPAQIRVIKAADNPWLEVTLHEGRNRQIRKMFEEIGHHVEKIRRVRYGPLELDLPPGESRPLTVQEIRNLKHAIEADGRRSFPSQGGRSATDADEERSERRFQRSERKERISPQSRRQPAARFAEQRREFRGGQRGRWSRDRKSERQPGERDRSRFADTRPHWEDRSQPQIRGKKQGESKGGGTGFRPHGQKPPGHSGGWGTQGRRRQGRHERPPGSSDHPVDPELVRDRRHEGKRRNRDRRS